MCLETSAHVVSVGANQQSAKTDELCTYCLWPVTNVYILLTSYFLANGAAQSLLVNVVDQSLLVNIADQSLPC